MDTTVILAQPRGTRLRADAVYVACVGLASGSTGQTGAPGPRQSDGPLDPPESMEFIEGFYAKKNP